MATGVESSSSPSGRGIAIDIPVSDATSLSSPPRRLQERLLEAKTPCTVEHIEAKLRLADLRRQQFYEKLASKARPKPRSPSYSPSNDEDLGQRLEAKLQAAEQKRLSILAKAQMRLARLDELRQAAKLGVEMRFKKEQERLGSKVELRVRKAEVNKMLILKAYRQRMATMKERTSQSLLQRIARESKYKERVHAAIHQKRAAAEKKRLGLLDAEKKKAQSRVLQVHQVAKSVCHQREVERRRMRDQLEDRLRRAKRQRAEYLRQRGKQSNSVRVKQADMLSRKLARCWRQFLGSRRTTLDLAKDYDALKINENCIRSMPFEQLVHLIKSSSTLQTVKTLLDRLESRFRASKAVAAADDASSLDNIDHLLKRVSTPKKITTPRTSMRSKEAKRSGANGDTVRSPARLSRYPARIVLCAYMILCHPDVVFSEQGEREVALAKSAKEFVQELELLIRIILDGPIQSSDEESDSMLPKRCTFRSQLAAFDKAWCSYLNCFAVWKVKDAQSLEGDLVRAACQLELSMIQKCKLTSEGDNDTLTHDMRAIQKQVMEDQRLMRQKVHHLSGVAGIERMENALSETRSKYFQAKENGSPVGSPVMHFLRPGFLNSLASSSVSISGDRSNVHKGVEKPSHVARALFKDEYTSASKGVSSSPTIRTPLDSQLGSVEKSITENELIVNEFLHERNGFGYRFNASDGDQNSIKSKIRRTMEQAFWDSVMESMQQDDPDYHRVVQLVTEVRDEIIEMAPESWKQEIMGAIDLDFLSQILKSGVLDIDYLGKILQFALGTLQKLSSPAQEDDMKVMYQKLLSDLADTCQTRDESKHSHAVAMIKGLRFVLEQIQALKQEISTARIRMMEPLLKGPAGLDYLKRAFANRYGSHKDACTSLPLTKQWLSSTKTCKDGEWEEHTNSLSALMSEENSSQVLLPSTTLRTGGNFQVKTNGRGMISANSNIAGSGGKQPEPECSGEEIDLLLRLGLLKLVCGVSGLTQEVLPETFMLNHSRVRAVQAQIQKIIVISTGILVCRQTLLMERLIQNSTAMESIVSRCTEKLLEVLDHVNDAGIEEIVDATSEVMQDGDIMLSADKLQSRKTVMARMLAKSLQAGDPVFEKVSHAVYLAARGVVLGGSGTHGRKLAEKALRQVGAVMLAERVVEAAEVLVVVATISVSVHGPWYKNLIDNM